MLLHYNASDGTVVTLPNNFFVRDDFTGATYPLTIRARLTKAQLDCLMAFAEAPNNEYVLYRVTEAGVDPIPVSETRRERAKLRHSNLFWPTPQGTAAARAYAEELQGRAGGQVDATA